MTLRDSRRARAHARLARLHAYAHVCAMRVRSVRYTPSPAMRPGGGEAGRDAPPTMTITHFTG